jgi:hypothetical protein
MLAGLGVDDLLVGITPGYGVMLRPFEACEMPILVRQYLRYHDAWSSDREDFAPVIDRWYGSLKPETFELLRKVLGSVK